MSQSNETKKSNRSYFFGMIFTLSAAVLWGSAYPIIKLSLGYYDAYNISMYRAPYASLALGIYLLTRRNKILPRRQDIPLLFLGSILGVAGFWIPLNFSVQLLDPDTSSFLVALYPLFAVVLATMALHEKMTLFAGVGVVVGIFGAYLLLGARQNVGFVGSDPLLGETAAY